MGDRPIVRVIGASDADATSAGLQVWIPQVIDWLVEGREPYVFVHQPENLDSPSIARRFHAAVRELVPAIAPLPDPHQVRERRAEPKLF